MAKSAKTLAIAGLFLVLSYVSVLYYSNWFYRSIHSVFEDVVDSLMSSYDVEERPSLKMGGRYLPRTPLMCHSIGKNITCDPPPATFSRPRNPTAPAACPEYFRWIHEDLSPWKVTGITRRMVRRAGRTANFRLLVVNGRMYAESYSVPFQTRDLFNLWGFVQLLRRHPDLPDLDLMFDCDDFPEVKVSDYHPRTNVTPPPLFGYCKDENSLNILFPDWSFWGWEESNIKPWKQLAMEMEEGNRRTRWVDRAPYAFWRGNPTVCGEREDLVRCNVSGEHDWNARIFNQDWGLERQQNFKHSNLADQCTYRYKIYVEGRSWSVSQKYILTCDSPTLLITPSYYDFCTRGLIPLQHYWPIDRRRKCSAIRFAVDWGNRNQEKAQEMGRNASSFILEEVKMDRVYDYMFHLLSEYAKLMRYKPVIPPAAVEICSDSMLCVAAEGIEKKYMINSQVIRDARDPPVPCELPPAYRPEEIDAILRKRDASLKLVESWEKRS